MDNLLCAVEAFAERAGRAYRHSRIPDDGVETMIRSWARAYAITHGEAVDSISPAAIRQAVTIYHTARRPYERGSRQRAA